MRRHVVIGFRRRHTQTTIRPLFAGALRRKRARPLRHIPNVPKSVSTLGNAKNRPVDRLAAFPNANAVGVDLHMHAA